MRHAILLEIDCERSEQDITISWLRERSEQEMSWLSKFLHWPKPVPHRVQRDKAVVTVTATHVLLLLSFLWLRFEILDHPEPQSLSKNPDYSLHWTFNMPISKLACSYLKLVKTITLSVSHVRLASTNVSLENWSQSQSKNVTWWFGLQLHTCSVLTFS
jgi:hypothetical protein